MDPLVSQPALALRTRCAVAADAPLLVALSGGADSVALLHLLRAAGHPVEAAHCHFHLRGAESDRDAAFVADLCRRLGVRLHRADFDTRAEARRRGVSIETAARDLRYAWFDSLLDERALAAVAVAHHRDDNAETLLLHLVRGAGLHGLSGMAWRRGRVVRPLLGVSRQELEAYLRRIGQDYVTDSTNLIPDVRRNRIRLEVLPQLRQLNPAIDRVLAETARRMAETEQIFDRAVAEARRRVCTEADGGLDIRLAALRAEPAPATLLHEWLAPYGYRPEQTADALAHADDCGTARYDSGAWTLVRDRGFLRLRRRPERFAPFVLDHEGLYPLPGGRQLRLARLSRQALGLIPRDAATACLDAVRVGRLICRPVERGDRFQPYGMRGPKLVSDYLTDRKRSPLAKAAACVVCSDETIAWLVGERPDQRFTLTDRTQDVVVLTLERTDGNGARPRTNA